MELNVIYVEDNRFTLSRMGDNFLDSIVTDPPYEYGFMGNAWDRSGIAFDVEFWKRCYVKLKPGGYLLSFGSTRTFHRMVSAIEDAGFEIRDSIVWLFGSGFPKSMNIGEGMGTALKPAHEYICVARKPLEGKNITENILKYGTGGINIDACRIDFKSQEDFKSATFGRGTDILGGNYVGATHSSGKTNIEANPLGRFPANVILDEFAGTLIDEQAPETGAFAPVKKGHTGKSKGIYGDYAQKGDDGDTFYDDKGGASRFFYCAKADRRERNAGLEQFKAKPLIWSSGTQNPGSFQSDGTNRSSQNYHPTVKPIKLIQYLQRLVTPKGGLTYDPFGGSGTCALAAQNEGFNWILSEISTEYADIAEKRIYHNGGLFQETLTSNNQLT